MNDNLSIVVTVIIMVAIIVIFPLYNFFERQDDMSYNVALSSATEFVDEVLNNGYIDQENYSNFVNKLATTGNIYDIQLEAHRNILTNNYNDNNQKSEGYGQKYEIDYNDDIFNAMDKDSSVNITTLNSTTIKNNIYHLNTGDGFYIKLKNKNKTMAGAIFNNIIPNSSKTRIAINYGGIVKNNTWSSVPNSDMYVTPGSLGESSIIYGPYLSKRSNITDSIDSEVDDGATLYFYAYYFNDNILTEKPELTSNNLDYSSVDIQKLNEFDPNVSSNFYIITLHNVRLKNGSNKETSKLVVKNAAMTTSSAVNSNSFTIYRGFMIYANSAGNGYAYILDGTNHLNSKYCRYNSVVNLRAIANDGYLFNYWLSDDGEKIATQDLDYVVNKSNVWTAYFKSKGPKDLNVTIDNSGKLYITWVAPDDTSQITSYTVSVDNSIYSTNANNFAIMAPHTGNTTICVYANYRDNTTSDKISGVWNVIKTQTVKTLYDVYTENVNISRNSISTARGYHSTYRFSETYRTPQDKINGNLYSSYSYSEFGSGTGSNVDNTTETSTSYSYISCTSDPTAEGFFSFTSSSSSWQKSSGQKYLVHTWNNSWSPTGNGSSSYDRWYTCSYEPNTYEHYGNNYDYGCECSDNIEVTTNWSIQKVQ